ncbi:RNA polymerase sigma-70 factor, ECF subfamily [Pricia antarctica]|uniref:RNA polymerase sigma-70 factor, ECF subfamily n=2 Tax=Pricia antarctica TaxID=641691 RepID=A0A1G7C7C8_9FLAO|nr:RNA polymerase sigma-70 factor, ECF subfamily [Pricia antarctica]
MVDSDIDDFEDICKPKVFESIFTTYARDLRKFVFFKTRNLDEAEDIVQEVFVKLWEDCANVYYGTVKSLLYTMANNLFLNVLKHKNVVLKHRKLNVKDRTHESPEFIMLEQEFFELLERAISDLPEKEREVFLLNRIERKKYKDISVLLGISVKAVEKRMHNALLNLKGKVGKV